MTQSERLTLLGQLARSPLWVAMAEEIDERMVRARAELENPGSTRDRDQFLKGGLAMLRDLRALPSSVERMTRRHEETNNGE